MRAAFTSDEKQMVDYLLGRLAEAERREITERVLTDDAVFQSVLAAEEALIDAYAAGDLDAVEARHVEATLLVTEEARVKLRTAQAMWQRHRQEESRRHRMKWLAVAATVLVAFGIGFGMFRSRPNLVAPPSASLVLLADGYRDQSGVPTVTLPAAGPTVSFTIALAPADRGAARYEVLVRSPHRGEQQLPARPAGESIEFALDRGSLLPGRYEFEIYKVDSASRTLIAFAPADLK